VTSLLVGFLIEPAVAPLIEPALTALSLSSDSALAVSIVIALVIATAAEMVIAELLPKNLAIARPFGVAYATVPALRIVNALLRPLILFLNASANWTVRRMGIEPQEELMPVRTLRELDLLIRSSREGGALLEEEFSLLSRSISFADMCAGDALVPRTSLIALSESTTLAELAETSLRTGHSRFPVYGENLDDITGIAHIKDAYRFAPSDRASTTVARIMREPLSVPESRDLESLLIEMRRDGVQMVVVVDEFGGTAGILTVEDVLEEIVGEIEDEHDPSEGTRVTAGVPEGVYVLSGRLHPGEVEEATGFELPDGPFDTLAGFLLWQFDGLPAAGDHTSYEGWEFKVVEMDRRRIDKVLLVAPGAGVEP
jgi:CBS domain containing-hemolysin-like protein